MTVTIIKGENYTERQFRKKGEAAVTVEHWSFPPGKTRLPKDCGVFVDGKKVQSYEDMSPSTTQETL